MPLDMLDSVKLRHVPSGGGRGEVGGAVPFFTFCRSKHFSKILIIMELTPSQRFWGYVKKNEVKIRK